MYMHVSVSVCHMWGCPRWPEEGGITGTGDPVEEQPHAYLLSHLSSPTNDFQHCLSRS